MRGCGHDFVYKERGRGKRGKNETKFVYLGERGEGTATEERAIVRMGHAFPSGVNSDNKDLSTRRQSWDELDRGVFVRGGQQKRAKIRQ